MGKFLKKFTLHEDYETYKNGQDFMTPNVSYCIDANDVHYNPWIDPRIVVKFNITDTSSPTNIIYSSAVSQFSKIEIDGAELPEVTNTYTFDTTGEHIVKYTTTDKTTIGVEAFRNCVNITSITIPNTVKTISLRSFSDCTGLTSITIPDSVTSIGIYAFSGCISLTSVTIPNTVTSIGNSAFSNCSNLTSITLNSNSIVSKTYTSSSNLKNIFGNQVIQYIIGDSVTSIGNYAFYNCSGFTSITIPNSVTTIGNFAFFGCEGLTSVTIPNSVTTIGSTSFFYCTGLTNITIPDSVTTIGQDAFSYCSGLTSVTIGNGVTSIGIEAFYNCTGLTSVIIYATTPPTLSNYNSFNNTNNCPIYVPSASVATYKAATQWSNLASRIQPIP